MNNKAIGVFDSGIGGLSVVKCIMDKLPHENIIYFGDIARIPYGTKSVSLINKFASQTVKFLVERNVKAIVIACNTITAVAYDTVKQLAGGIPVIDVISNGAKACAKYNRVGVIATNATIKSNAYVNAIHKINPDIEVFSQACPLLVPLIEEGIITHNALDLILVDYLKAFTDKNIQAMVLGCTHYPLIKESIKRIMGNDVVLIDPANNTCSTVIDILQENSLQHSDNNNPQYNFFITDVSTKFQQIGELFLNTPMQNIELVSIE